MFKRKSVKLLIYSFSCKSVEMFGKFLKKIDNFIPENEISAEEDFNSDMAILVAKNIFPFYSILKYEPNPQEKNEEMPKQENNLQCSKFYFNETSETNSINFYSQNSNSNFKVIKF